MNDDLDYDSNDNLPQVQLQITKPTDKFYSVQEADSFTEADLEESLRICTNMTSYIHINPVMVRLCILMAMEKSRNWLYKYRTSVSKYDENLLDDIDKLLRGIINGYSPQAQVEIYVNISRRIIICCAEKLGFRRGMREGTNWQNKLMTNQQVVETDELEALMYGDASSIEKIAGFVDASITQEMDQKIIITGAPGNGKSSTGIQLAQIISKQRGETFNLGNRKGIYYTDIDGLHYRLTTTEHQVIVLDESILASLSSLDTLTKTSKNIISVFTMVRNKGHVIIIIYPKLSRAVRSLLELSTMWVHKAERESALLMSKSKIYVGKDPYQIKEIEEAASVLAISTKLISNKTFIVQFKCNKLDMAVEEEYKRNKALAQLEYGTSISMADAENKERADIGQRLLAEFEQGKFTKATLKAYLINTWNTPLPNVDRYFRYFVNALAKAGVKSR